MGRPCSEAIEGNALSYGWSVALAAAAARYGFDAHGVSSLSSLMAHTQLILLRPKGGAPGDAPLPAAGPPPQNMKKPERGGNNTRNIRTVSFRE